MAKAVKDMSIKSGTNFSLECLVRTAENDETAKKDLEIFFKSGVGVSCEMMYELIKNKVKLSADGSWWLTSYKDTHIIINTLTPEEWTGFSTIDWDFEICEKGDTTDVILTNKIDDWEFPVFVDGILRKPPICRVYRGYCGKGRYAAIWIRHTNIDEWFFYTKAVKVSRLVAALHYGYIVLDTLGVRISDRLYDVDHIVPRGMGGSDSITNLQVITCEEHKEKTKVDRQLIKKYKESMKAK